MIFERLPSIFTVTKVMDFTNHMQIGGLARGNRAYQNSAVRHPAHIYSIIRLLSTYFLFFLVHIQ